jgi:hypothetical protein
MRRLAIPAITHHAAAGMSGIGTTRNLHLAMEVASGNHDLTRTSILVEWERMFAEV